jgi:hypothetical protein
MDRHILVAAPWDPADDNSPTLSIYFDISTGHYECDIDNKIAGVIKADDNGGWVDVESGNPTDLSRRAVFLFEMLNAE